MNYQQKQKWNRLNNQPFMVWILVAITVLVFLAMTIDGMTQGLGIEGSMYSPILVKYGALERAHIIFGHEYWRFITPIFVHVGFSHIIVNMVTIYFIGIQLEAILGHTRFLLLYLITGISGNLVSFSFGNPQVISAGASTSLFGLFGVFVALGRVYHHPAVKAMGQRMLMLILMNLLLTLPSNLLSGSNIDILGHVGGVLGGLFLGFVVRAPRLEGDRYDIIERNVHQRIIGAVLFVFMVIICVAYAFKKFSEFL